MTTTFAIIPARGGSKGVPDKNIRNLFGHTLLEWSIEACKKTPLIDEIYVSTDSKKYQSLAIKLGAKVPFLRPESISQDTSTDYEFICHALNWFENNNKRPNFIAHIRPTTPIRDPQIINKAILEMYKRNKATSLRSVHSMSESAFKTFVITKEGILKSITAKDTNIEISNNPRQSFPETFIANGYVDVLSTDFILKTQTIHGNISIPFLTPTSYEIDVEEDFDFLEFQIKKNSNLLKKIFY